MNTSSSFLILFTSVVVFSLSLSNSAHFSANLSRFSSPICMAVPSISSSSSSSTADVQVSSSSSTSNIHSMFKPMTCSNRGCPWGSQKSFARPATKDMVASMALCLMSDVEKVWFPHSDISVPHSSCKPLVLKNSGSSSAALIKEPRISLRYCSFSLFALRPWMAATTPGMEGMSTSAFLGSMSSIRPSTSLTLAVRISGDELPTHC
mmetsp:Transcript_748/g.2087  ORF Transcript_748/g.2087 Transcript_748/m.2087 type:complete len:207 (-) Transcript_748:612-1232(-)